MDQDQTSIFVRKAVGGEPDGVSWIVTHFQPFVEAHVRMASRGHGSPQDVEDIAADVWTVTLGNLANLRPRDGRLAPVLVTYLGTTVLQMCNNFLREQARRSLHQGGAGGNAASSDATLGVSRLPAQTMGVVTRAVHRDLGSAVSRCLDELAEDKREVLVLRLMEQRTNQEIGERLGIPANTVAVRYRRALTELRAVLPSDVLADIESVAG